jgi:hypothetical protein
MEELWTKYAKAFYSMHTALKKAEKVNGWLSAEAAQF